MNDRTVDTRKDYDILWPSRTMNDCKLCVYNDFSNKNYANNSEDVINCQEISGIHIHMTRCHV